MNRTFFAFAAAALLAAGGPAMAEAGCPAGKQGKPPVEAPTVASGEFTHVIDTIDLSQEAAMLKDHVMRIRTVTVAPGGTIPLHSHADRPAFFYVQNGDLTIQRQDCTVPYVMRPGDVSKEGKDTTHWARNDGKEFVILVVTDVVHTKDMKALKPM